MEELAKLNLQNYLTNALECVEFKLSTFFFCSFYQNGTLCLKINFLFLSAST